jgi:CheY-like chemotaxis protein
MDENDPYRFSLILMDCNMPFMDGYQATKNIRKIFTNSEIPKEYQPKIIAVTGHVENEYIQKAIQSGMDKVYPKPLPIKEFGQLLLNMKFIDEVPNHLRLDSVED